MDNDRDEFFEPEYREEECENDYVEININGIKGQELLMSKYLLEGPQAVAQTNKVYEAAAESLKRKSIMMDKSFYDRQSVSTPLLSNKLRRNMSNNNSVYSNKSSNRIIKSEMNSRSLINPVPAPTPTVRQKERLDTVLQNSSEISLKAQEAPSGQAHL